MIREHRAIAYALGAVAALEIMLIILVGYPGAMSSDTFGILLEARANEYRDTHPPLLTFVWRQLDKVWAGQAPVFILDLSLFYGGLFLLFFAYRQKLGWLSVGGLLAAGMWPPVVGIIGTVWLDVFMASLYMFSIGVFCASREWGSWRTTGRCIAWFFLILGLATRLNSAPAAIPIAIMFLMPTDKAPALTRAIPRILTGAAIVLVALFANTAITDRVVNESRSYFWTYLLVFDIAGVSNFVNSNLFPQPTFSANTLEDIKTLYSPRYHGYLAAGQSATGATAKAFNYGALQGAAARQELIVGWAQAIKDHPSEYFLHRSLVYRHLTTKLDAPLWAPVYDAVSPEGLPLEFMGIRFRPNLHNKFYRALSWLSEKTGLFEPRWYIALAAFSAMLAFILNLRLWEPMLLSACALAGSCLFHTVGLFFTAVSADFRYSHWSIISSLLSFLLVGGYAGAQYVAHRRAGKAVA